MQYINKKRQATVKEKFRTVRPCSEENVQYLNYLVEKKSWSINSGPVETTESLHDIRNSGVAEFEVLTVVTECMFYFYEKKTANLQMKIT
jgi:hypothetical protein